MSAADNITNQLFNSQFSCKNVGENQKTLENLLHYLVIHRKCFKKIPEEYCKPPSCYFYVMTFFCCGM